MTVTRLYYQGNQYSCREGETILQVFMRYGVTVPFSCGSGVCHVCLRRCERGNIPAAAQQGLRETLKQQGYLLICRCVPENDMNIAPPRVADLFNRAVVYKKELLTPDICRLLVEPATQLYYHAGQFINIRNEAGELRSYSLTSVPHEDYFMEIHVKRVPGGIMTDWIFNELSENDEFEFQGPEGNCYYVQGKPDQPLLLIGTGTGISPLLGIARDALGSGHRGPVCLYHGSSNPHGLYIQDNLRELAGRYVNFHPVSCVSAGAALAGVRTGRASEVAHLDHADLRAWRVYLCGHPEMVEAARQTALRSGADEMEIHADPFWYRNTIANTSPEALAEERIRRVERRKYPDPDPGLWEGLGKGRLLSKVLVDFYNRVYEDPLLSPFFEGVTKQRLIEKQYNFMRRVLTGEEVYFGERPRNAHHWMVISNELFNHRENLMESCLRRYGVPEYLVRRLRAIEETYREDIVKDKPWKKILFGKEVPVEGFDEMTLDDATLCDSCRQEIPAGSHIQYHVRLGKVYCQSCRQDSDG